MREIYLTSNNKLYKDITIAIGKCILFENTNCICIFDDIDKLTKANTIILEVINNDFLKELVIDTHVQDNALYIKFANGSKLKSYEQKDEIIRGNRSNYIEYFDDNINDMINEYVDNNVKGE